VSYLNRLKKVSNPQGRHLQNHQNPSEGGCVGFEGSELGLSQIILAMAERWEYASDELAEALSLAAADPVGWDRLCTHDQAIWRPESEERDTQPLQTVRCADCQHYQRTNHPRLGHCVQGEIEAVVGLWDSDRRLCESYRADEQTGSA